MSQPSLFPDVPVLPPWQGTTPAAPPASPGSSTAAPMAPEKGGDTKAPKKSSKKSSKKSNGGDPVQTMGKGFLKASLIGCRKISVRVLMTVICGTCVNFTKPTQFSTHCVEN